MSILIFVSLIKQSEYCYHIFKMKILHFLIGDSFAIRFLSVFTNTTINEHHAFEFDWSNGEENIMDISKLGSQYNNLDSKLCSHKAFQIFLNPLKNFKFGDSTGSRTSCSFVLGGKQFIVGGAYR